MSIDIYKNCPRIISHTSRPNTTSHIGTEMTVLISGNWTTYKSRVVQYLQQLAIITPYAKLEMSYGNKSDVKKEMNLRFDRRSEQMPAQAKEVKYHPSSVSYVMRPKVHSEFCVLIEETDLRISDICHFLGQ
jgi:DNA topoisomerase-6 subunit B